MQGALVPATPTIGPHSLRPSQLARLDLFDLDISNQLLPPVLLHGAMMVYTSIGLVTGLLRNLTIAFLRRYLTRWRRKVTNVTGQWLGVKTYR